MSAQILADGRLDLAICLAVLIVTGKSDHGDVADRLVRMLKHQLMPVIGSRFSECRHDRIMDRVLVELAVKPRPITAQYLLELRHDFH